MLAPRKDLACWWGWNWSCLSCWSRGIYPDLTVFQMFPSDWVSAIHWYACKHHKLPCAAIWHHEGGWGSHLLPAWHDAVTASIWNWPGSRIRAQPRRYKRMVWTGHSVSYTTLDSLVEWTLLYFVILRKKSSQVTWSIDQYLHQLTSRNLWRADTIVSYFKAKGCAL